MTNLKKILSSVLALAMSATLAAPAFAETLTVSVNSADILGSFASVDGSETEVETTAYPEVLMYRDYEDLSGNETRLELATNWTFNQKGSFGTTKFGTNDGLGLDPVVVNGADGKGLGFNTRSTDGAKFGTFSSINTTGYSTGKIYIAFDMQRKSDAELDAQDGTTDGCKIVINEETGAEEKQYVQHDTYFYINDGNSSTQQYGRIYTRHTNSKAAPWKGTNPGVYIPDENVHRYEYVIDLDNDTFKGYVDGVQNGNGTTYAANFVRFNMALTNAIKYLDNFAVVHYPTNCENTFSLNAGEINYSNNALTVDFDSDTETVTDTATYTANYPIAVTSEVTKDIFAVTNTAGEAVAVSSVSKNAATGSYNVVLADEIQLGETYTVSVNGTVTDILGAAFDAESTAEFVTIAPTVLYFRDYEDYKTGGTIYDSGRGTGVTTVVGNPTLNTGSVAVTGVDGTAVDLCAGSGAPNLTMETPITEGLVYIGVDLEPYTAEEIAAGTGEKDDAWFVVKSSDNSTGRYVRIGVGRDPSSWEDIARFGQLNDGYQRLEVVINLNTKKVYSYCNGVQTAQVLDYARNNFNFISFDICSNGLKKWDNLAVVHYPVGATDTFSLTSKGVDFENNALNVDFDNDAKTTVDTTTYAANYPTILTADITPEDVTVKNSEGEDVAVAAVNKNAAFGSYNVVLEEEIAEGETYTVSVDSDLVSTLGAAIKGTSTDVKVTAPNVLIYRDYENYASGKELYNGSGAYGSWKAGASTGFALSALQTEGKDGIAVTTPAKTGTSGTGTWGAKFADVLTSGKFYIGYDIEKKSDAEYVEMYGESQPTGEVLGTILTANEWKDDYQLYLRLSATHSSVTSGLITWHNPITPYYLGEGYTRVEYIVDLDANTISRYINGELEASQGFTANIYGYRQQFNSQIKTFDNFTMLHIPSDVKAQTFSLQSAKVDKENNTISVKLRSDIANAAYPIVTDEITAEDFAVTDKDGNALTITTVAKGDAFGEYVIAVEEALTEQATYTVATSAERTDVLGATLDTDAVAEAYVVPEVYTDVNFDYYNGVGKWFDAANVAGQKPGYQQAVTDEKYGKGLDFFLPETDTWLLSAFNVPFKSAVNEGKLVVSFDWMYDEFPNQRQQLQFNAAPGAVSGAFNGNYYLAYFDKTEDGKVSVKTPVAIGSWNNNANKILEADTMYHFDFVFDYDSKKYEAFVNGESLGGYTINPATNAVTGAYFSFSVGTSFLDNVRVAYSDDDSFVINRAKWQGSYAEVLLSEAADLDSLALADSVVVTDKATGQAVEATVELSGRRVIIAGLDKSKSYTVTLPENYKSVTGNTLANNIATIEAGKFSITSVKVVADETGAALTDEKIAELKAGDKVYAQVTYVNETGVDKTFTVLGATYAGERMATANFDEITALGTVTEQVTTYVEIPVTDVTEFSTKAFVVDGFANLKPIK